MANKGVYIAAKKSRALGCLVYLCKTPEEIRSFSKIIKKIQGNTAQRLCARRAVDFFVR